MEDGTMAIITSIKFDGKNYEEWGRDNGSNLILEQQVLLMADGSGPGSTLMDQAGRTKAAVQDHGNGEIVEPGPVAVSSKPNERGSLAQEAKTVELGLGSIAVGVEIRMLSIHIWPRVQSSDKQQWGRKESKDKTANLSGVNSALVDQLVRTPVQSAGGLEFFRKQFIFNKISNSGEEKKVKIKQQISAESKLKSALVGYPLSSIVSKQKTSTLNNNLGCHLCSETCTRYNKNAAALKILTTSVADGFVLRRDQKEIVEEGSMDASSSFGFAALRGKVFCRKCRQPTELEQRVSRSERNFLRPYMSFMKCGGFICWAEEEGRGESRGGLQSGSSMYRGRQRVGEGSPVEVAINVDDCLRAHLGQLMELSAIGSDQFLTQVGPRNHHQDQHLLDFIDFLVLTLANY
ncbi:hypothetical protein Cgig2_027499 [Carnegiea gigantea]|uniref:Uncharacterized protein n=1 Tax=Carnegiea gigantea TaxID=171969 RepID=A0A9Q1KPY0_9CARY|nr:hypothetical protein Cgig2_027499 [Carnegiea gigantea]